MKQKAAWCEECRTALNLVGADVKECSACGRPTTPLVLLQEVLATVAVRLSCAPGDVVVFETSQHLPMKAYEMLASMWEEKVAPGTKAVLLDGGIHLAAILTRETTKEVQP